jgi:hypothetical protein
MGFDFKRFLDLLKALGPAVLPAVLPLVPGGAKLAPFIPTITSAIGEAEQIKGASSVEKKQHVLNVVADAVTAVNATGKAKFDHAEANAAASAGVDAVVAAINAVEKSKPAPKPAPPKP